jgi:hypothetical protein
MASPWFISVIVNKSDLLFYIRKPAREELKVDVDHVARLFDHAEVSQNPSQEITISQHSPSGLGRPFSSMARQGACCLRFDISDLLLVEDQQVQEVA